MEQLQNLINDIYAQIIAIVSGMLALVKIIGIIWNKITRKKAKTDRRDIENVKTAIEELKEQKK